MFQNKMQELKMFAKECFVAGTQVMLPDFSTKNIEDVGVGEEVLTFDFGKGELVGRKVTLVMSQLHTGEGDDYTVGIKFEGGVENQNTNTHPYFIKDKGWASWKPELTMIKHALRDIHQLEVGDSAVLLENGKVKDVKIESIEEIFEEVVTYNLMNVEDTHNFFANGILVHNKGDGGSTGGNIGVAGMPDGAIGNAPGGGAAVGPSGEGGVGGIGAGTADGPGGDQGSLAGFADMGIAVDMGSAAAPGAAPTGSFGDSSPAAAPADAPGDGSVAAADVAAAQADVDAANSMTSLGFDSTLATTTLTATSLLGVPAPASIGLAGLAGVIGGSDFGDGGTAGPPGGGEGGGPGDFDLDFNTNTPAPVDETPTDTTPPVDVPAPGGSPGDVVDNNVEAYLEELSARRDQRFGFADTMLFEDDGSPSVFVESAWGAGGASPIDIETDEDVEFIFG